LPKFTGNSFLVSTMAVASISMSDINGLRPSIQSFILENFPAAKKRGLSDDLPLLESGIVDSLGVLDVVGFLEQTFQIKIDDDELTPDNFANIRSLVAFVESKRGCAEISARE
jgi:acyl carrier protein